MDPTPESGRATAPVRCLVPGLVLVLVTAVSGTGAAAASAAGAATSHLVVLLLAIAGAAAWRDPLALGRRGRWLPVALWVAVAASCWASPVGRAGWTVVALLPAWYLMPAAVARLWRTGDGPASAKPTPARSTPAESGPAGPAARGLWVVSAVVGGIALVALLGMVLHGDPRASAPLGHHNLLAVWLVTLLPLAVLPWRHGGGARVLALAAGILGLATLALTRSLSGTLAVAVMLVVALALRRRITVGGTGGGRGIGKVEGGDSGRRRRGPGRFARRAAATGLLAVPLLVALPRLLAIVRGVDLSVAARATYWAAGWRGFSDRPALGWGPGSTPWTVHEWLRWIPGVNPPQQMVGDLHSLPLTLLYETGATGTLLAVAVAGLFAYRGWRGLPGARDPVLAAAGLVGLAGAAVVTLGVSPLAVPAVVLAPAVAAAAALAGGATRYRERKAEESENRKDGEALPGPARLVRSQWPAWLVLAAGALLLGWLDLAHRHYDRSIEAPSPAARAELARAVDLDPAFPLYRAHLAASAAPSGPGAGEALAAARAAEAVPALWLQAGNLALAAGEPWAAIALERACRLDPLAPLPAWLLARIALAEGDRSAAARSAARALLAEPRLAAATLFDEHPGLREAAVAEILAWPGLSGGWRVALAEAVAGLEGLPAGGVRNLRLVTGGSRSSSLAFFTFRRRPRPLQLASVPLHEGWARALALPPATTLRETSATAFGERGCGP